MKKKSHEHGLKKVIMDHPKKTKPEPMKHSKDEMKEAYVHMKKHGG
jgi:hypothetical protein